MNKFGIVPNTFPTRRNPGSGATKTCTGLKQFSHSSPVHTPSALLPVFFFLLMITAVLISCDSGGPSKKSPLPPSTLVRIGTGNVNGLYYPTGRLIAEVVNRKRKEYGIRCQVQFSGGSFDNFREIMAGNLELGLGQSDFLFKAFQGQGQWRDKGAQKNLRAVLALNKESLTLVAAEDSGIKRLDDLRGKRVNIGSPGSGERWNSIDALENVSIDYAKDLVEKEFKLAEADLLLQSGELDAFFHAAGHPSPVIIAATKGRRKVRFISISGLDKLLRKHPYYVEASIPIKFYPRVMNEADVETFGVVTTLVTADTVKNEVVYSITKEVFENIDFFKKAHPAFQRLTKQSMVQCLGAPIHPGAQKYYDEVGLVPSCLVK